MAIWADSNNVLYDDAGGAALGLSTWPSGLTLLTDAQVDAIRNPPETLSQAQGQKLASLYSSYESAIQQPVTYTSQGGVSKLYQADSASVSNVQCCLSAYTALGSTPPGFYWVSQDNTRVPFVLADIQGLADAIMSQGWAAFQNLQDKKAAVRAATSVSQVQAISW